MKPATAIRRLHRWVGLLFTLSVISNFAALAFGTPPTWITYAPLAPLFLLMFSGLFMLVRPSVSVSGRMVGGKA